MCASQLHLQLPRDPPENKLGSQVAGPTESDSTWAAGFSQRDWNPLILDVLARKEGEDG